MNEIRILSPSALRALSEETPSQELPFFREGETLGGRVVRQIDDHRAFLRVRGKNILVESQIPLPADVDLCFRVEEVQSRVSLKLLPAGSEGEEKLASLLKKLLSGDVAFRDLAGALQKPANREFQALPPHLQESGNRFFHLLQRFSSQVLFSGDPGDLRRLIDESGFFWENKVMQWTAGDRKISQAQLIRNDLKGLGSKLLEEIESIRPAGGGGAERLFPVEELKDSLEPFLRKIELYQTLNVPPAGEERFYLFLPFWAGGQLRFLELALSLPEKGAAGEEREGCSVLFLLTLPALGKVRIEVQVKGNELFCRFRLSEPGISEFVRRALPGLGVRLGELGFQAHLEAVVDAAERPGESLLGELETGSPSLVNRIV